MVDNIFFFRLQQNQIVLNYATGTCFVNHLTKKNYKFILNVRWSIFACIHCLLLWEIPY